jgi:hypothetical protein
LTKHPDDLAKAAETLKKARFSSKEQFERRFHKKLQPRNYNPGELVLIRNTQIENRMSRKHMPRYLGPYEVVRKNRGGAYVIQELDGSIYPGHIAAFRLIPYISRKHWFMQENSANSSDESDTSETE